MKKYQIIEKITADLEIDVSFNRSKRALISRKRIKFPDDKKRNARKRSLSVAHNK